MLFAIFSVLLQFFESFHNKVTLCNGEAGQLMHVLKDFELCTQSRRCHKRKTSSMLIWIFDLPCMSMTLNILRRFHTVNVCRKILLIFNRLYLRIQFVFFVPLVILGLHMSSVLTSCKLLEILSLVSKWDIILHSRAERRKPTVEIW